MKNCMINRSLIIALTLLLILAGLSGCKNQAEEAATEPSLNNHQEEETRIDPSGNYQTDNNELIITDASSEGFEFQLLAVSSEGNTGDFEGTAEYAAADTASYEDGNGFSLQFSINEDRITIKETLPENGVNPYAGIGVSFAGDYEMRKETECLSSRGTTVTVPSFLNDEQQTVFADALDIAYAFQVSTGFYGAYDSAETEYYKYETANGQVYSYMKCDESYFSGYEEFYNYLLSAYTKEAADNMLAENETYIDVGGELYFISADRGTDITHCGTTYDLIDSSEDELRFNVIGEYLVDFEEPEGATTTKEYPITLVKTDDGWRAQEFELWY